MTTGNNAEPDQTNSIRSLLYCTRFGPYLQEIQKHKRTRSTCGISIFPKLL